LLAKKELMIDLLSFIPQNLSLEKVILESKAVNAVILKPQFILKVIFQETVSIN
jgi:hypothetical protein